MKLLCLFLLFVTFNLNAQSKDPDEIIKRLKDGFSKVKDYTVDVHVKVDVDFLKVPETKAKIYFKAPDKMHLESDNFAMLPKEGMDFSPMTLLKKEYSAFYQREDQIDGHQVSVVKIIPLQETAEVILSTFWIDQKENIIRRVESSTKTSGTFSIDLKYEDTHKELHLPKKMIFTFNVERMSIPRALSGEIDSEPRKNESRNTTGKVYIHYSNYKINQGLSDHMFQDKKKK